jgi:uncharacterized protein YdhG (YjbR/CyaY superfamily)
MGRRSTVSEFISDCSEVQLERLLPLLDYMRQKYPDWREALSYQMPMFKQQKQYIAFSVASEHFSVHSLDFEQIAAARKLFPKAGFGKGCVKISYDEPDPFDRICILIDSIVERNAEREILAEAAALGAYGRPVAP